MGTSAGTTSFDLVIRGGRLITAERTLDADIGIRGGKIAAVAPHLEGKNTVEARGLLVLPGAVDPHVHLELPVAGTRSSDDWFTGTRAAACGGTTTVIDFVDPRPGDRLDHALATRRDLANGRAAVDYGLHMTLTSDDKETLAAIPRLCAGGCTSFKTYLTYDSYRLSDSALLRVLEAVKNAGGITLVHAENDAIID